MRESDKLSAVGWCVGVALLLGLFVAVWGVQQTGNCWQKCFATEHTVMSPWPLAVWGAAVAIYWAGACAYSWARSLCPTDTPRERWTSAAKASLITFPPVWAVLVLVVQ